MSFALNFNLVLLLFVSLIHIVFSLIFIKHLILSHIISFGFGFGHNFCWVNLILWSDLFILSFVHLVLKNTLCFLCNCINVFLNVATGVFRCSKRRFYIMNNNLKFFDYKLHNKTFYMIRFLLYNDFSLLFILFYNFAL